MYAIPSWRRMFSTRRIGRLVGALAITGGALAAIANPAAADDFTCKSGGGAINCFSTTRMANRDHAVHVGIDISMSRQDAQSIVDAPGEALDVRVFGDDTSYDNFLIWVPITWSAAGDGGLSAEFDTVVDGELLDEDDSFFSGRLDEVYAIIRLIDPRSGQTRTWTTNVIVEYF